ncbi:unnamed protein product, partial [Brenthis ino]
MKADWSAWFQVVEETDLPAGLCCVCADNAISTWQFRHLCHESHRHWTQISTVLMITDIPTTKDKTFYISTSGTLLKDMNNIHTLTNATKRLNFLIGNTNKVRAKYKKKKSKVAECKFKCRDCGKEFELPYFLNRHLINSSKRACTLCGKIVSREKLAVHLQRVHQRFVEFCNVCYKVFDEKDHLDRHKEILHGDSCLQCKICKLGFKSERSLSAHMYTHTLFNCSSCNSSFENRKCYLYHRHNCKGSKFTKQDVYECHDCGSKYTRKPSLRVHIVQKHLNVLPYICQICGKRSSSKTHHQSHELIHKTERKIYQCYCGAKMRTVLGFHMHQRIHSGEKPYECQECGDKFLSASRRLDHIKRKHRSKDHGCLECDARFVRPSELKKHCRLAHFVNTAI